MEYIFGNDEQSIKRILLTKGKEHTNLNGFCEVVREYEDCTITDNFCVVRKINSKADTEHNCYDWYEIDMHYRTIDKTKPIKSDMENLEIQIIQTQLAMTEVYEMILGD